MELPTIMNTEKKKDEKIEALTDVEEVKTKKAKKDEKVKWVGDNYIDIPRLKELYEKFNKEHIKKDENYSFEDFLR